MIQQFHYYIFYKEKRKHILCKHLYMNVDNSLIYNNQKLETIQLSNRWMDKVV